MSFKINSVVFIYNRIRHCLVPLNDRHFAILEGGLDKGDFYFINIYILKIGNIKNLSQSNFFNLL